MHRTKPRTSPRRLIGVGGALLLALCFGDVRALAAGPSKTRLVDALRLVPARNAERRGVLLTDQAAARTATGKQRVADVSVALAKAGISFPTPLLDGSRYREGEKNLALIGVDPSSAEVAAEAGVVPDVLRVASGSFKAGDIAKKITACGKACGKPPKTEKVGSSTIYSWSSDPQQQDFKKILAPPVFDQLGRAPILVVADGRVAFAYNADVARLVAAGSGRSLADLSAYRIAAESLQNRGTLAAFLTEAFDDLLGPFSEVTINLNRAKSEPLEWELAGVGIGGTVKAPDLQAALVFASATSAKSELAILRARFRSERDPTTNVAWSDEFTGIDGSVVDRTVVMTLRGPGATLWGARALGGDLTPFLPY